MFYENSKILYIVNIVLKTKLAKNRHSQLEKCAFFLPQTPFAAQWEEGSFDLKDYRQGEKKSLARGWFRSSRVQGQMKIDVLSLLILFFSLFD